MTRTARFSFAFSACSFLLTSSFATPLTFADEPPLYQWHEVEIDKIDIGYGVQLADVDGDGLTDIVLADKSTIQWYENPTWKKHVIAKDLTERDNVCVTARDIDGDGKCELAVGGQWNFRETIKDGAVFYLEPPKDRRGMWAPIKLYNEPSTHRMHWIRRGDGSFSLVVKPLRGKGSQNGDGPGFRLLEYIKPEDSRGIWKTELISDFLHLSHNFHPVNWDDDSEEEIIIAAKEGVWYFDRVLGSWKGRQLTRDFAGEIRDGKLPNGKRFIVTVEPMHGNKSAVYVEPDSRVGLWDVVAVLDQELKDGHALAVADYLGVGSDQVVVGWRAMHPKGVPGIKLFTPVSGDGSKWRSQLVSGEELAVEDIKAGDLNGDGLPDIVATARHGWTWRAGKATQTSEPVR
ncbi:MAG: VCBS repeat-containing protein, partial [Planctomycetota bacterium]